MTAAPDALQQMKTALALHPQVRAVETLADNMLRVRAWTVSRDWTLRIEPDAGGGLPRIRVLDEPLIGRLAHVNHEGTVCITDNEGLSIDWTQPGRLVTHAVSEALRELEANLQRERTNDFSALLDEFEGYWFSLPQVQMADVHVLADDKVRTITAYHDAQRNCLAFTEEPVRKRETYGGLVRYRQFVRERALYVPLTKPVMPPNRKQPLTARRLIEWLNAALDPAGRAALEKELRAWPRRMTSAYILFSQPRSGTQRAVFGVQCLGPAARHPLTKAPRKWQVRPVSLRHHLPSDLRPRGGAIESLAARHVAIIGCGALGGRIAEQLSLAGVGKLAFVDPDRLLADNLYRHVLGGGYCGLYKAYGLKVSLESRLPNLTIRAEPMTLDAWVTRKRLADVDAVVLATGKPHIERAFVRMTRGWPELHAPVLSTWLEPLGLGGHALLTVPGEPGCLECLYTNNDGTSRLSPKVAHVEPDQRISRNLTGCVGSFTPYSALDAAQTALLAARLLTGFLTEKASERYAAWRGPDRECLQLGFATTPWYRQLSDEAVRKANAQFARVPCPVCGGRP